MSMLSEYNYHGNTESSSIWKNKKKTNVSKGSLVDSFRFKGSTTQTHMWNKVGYDFSSNALTDAHCCYPSLDHWDPDAYL